jgi:hypothetical protein
VPETVALHSDVVFTITIGGSHVTSMEVIVEDGGGCCCCTVIDVLPDLLGSSLLVAVTVTAPVFPGAVKVPLELIVPLAADHETAEL